MPRVLVTGSAGFIGRHVVREAQRRGYEVAGIDVVPARGTDVVDITDFRALEERVRGCEYVINLAAVTSNVEFERDPYRCYSVNVNGFLNVLEASRRNSVRKVVYASSAAVYLDSFSENVVIDHNRQRNHYAKSKLMNEMHAASYSDIYGLRCVGLRLFNVFGPDENQKGDYASIISRFLRDHEEGKDLIVYGDGTQARDFIHVDDASRIIMDILERGEESVYNVGTGRSHRYIDIARAIDRERIRFVPNPLRSYQMLTRADVTRLRSVSDLSGLTDPFEYIGAALSRRPGQGA